MNHEAIINQLASHAQVLETLVDGMPQEQLRWKQSPEKWSVLEVVGHLYDEELEDFRPRVEGPLGAAGFTPIPLGDPEERAAEREYNMQETDKLVRCFKEERIKSTRLLRSLDNPNWKSGFEIPSADSMYLTAENVLAAWLGHDNLHFRQILTIQWNYLSKDIEPLTLDYVGQI